MRKTTRYPLLVLSLITLSVFLSGANASEVSTGSFLDWASRPPMGWNSWDCFGCTVTESLVKTNADYMAANLASHGWQYIVVDIQWYEPQTSGWNYDPNPKPALDEYGRLLPDEKKFPSSVGNNGFKPLADYVHSRGLKFGVHLIRGIPREAVKRNTPIFGSHYRAAQIADTNNLCAWNPDMFGVDMSKPGAQEYYDSVFRLLASWGVDFVKVDDIARPYRIGEIDAIRKAIDGSGRPMVLSLSPGPTPLSEASRVIMHANMWRLTDDFWDDWKLLKHAFDTCNDWTPYRAAGHWPDPDMLPLGYVRVGPTMEHHTTRFTPDEQRTLMTLWCISRAPLMFGGHLPWNDNFTESLITNDEVLSIDRMSAGNRQLFRTNDLVAWVADVPNSADRYLALFNAQDNVSNVASVPLSDLGFHGTVSVRDLWAEKDLGSFTQAFGQMIPPHGAGLFRISP
jgi:alpha-galactosidase